MDCVIAMEVWTGFKMNSTSEGTLQCLSLTHMHTQIHITLKCIEYIEVVIVFVLVTVLGNVTLSNSSSILSQKFIFKNHFKVPLNHWTRLN